MYPLAFRLLPVDVNVLLALSWSSERLRLSAITAGHVKALKNSSGSIGPVFSSRTPLSLLCLTLTLFFLLALDVHQPSPQTAVL